MPRSSLRLLSAGELVPRTPSLPHRARVVLRFRPKAKLSASVQVTSGGIVAIGVLVSGILLSTAALVRAAKH